MAALAYVLLKMVSDHNKSPVEERRIEANAHAKKVPVSFDVWESIKFGFGLGIGLILATGIFWLLVGSFLIIGIKSFLSATL